jgi:peptide/nickel transport system permease protein
MRKATQENNMTVAELDNEGLLTPEEESFFSITWKRFRKHRLAVAGMIIMSSFIFICLFAPWLSPYDPIQIVKDANTGQILKNAPPSAAHMLGTDSIGRDIMTRLLYAGRISLFLAFIVTIVSEVIGTVIGAISGYVGGFLDDVIQRIAEFLTTLPLLALLLAFSALLRGITIPGLPAQWSSVFIIGAILIVFGWMGTSFLVRGQVLSLRNQEFTEAARALGMSHIGIIMKHMVPNSLAPIIVHATLSLGAVIILESALSFLGFGVQPPVATWGNMLAEYQDEMWTEPAKVFYPGLAIFLSSLAFNYMGDGLRDALDPRLKN